MTRPKWCDCGAALRGAEQRCPACEARHRRSEPKPKSVEARLAAWGPVDGQLSFDEVLAHFDLTEADLADGAA